MTQEERSQQTRLALASGLKELMKEKPLSKISVKDLVTRCNVNRKTFYYHFTDIYDLLKWMLKEEALDVMKKFDYMTDFQDAALYVINYVEENNHILQCAYDSMGRDGLKEFLDQNFITIIRPYVNRYVQGHNLSASESYKEFICDFFTDAISSVIIASVLNPKHMDKQTLVSYMYSVLYSSIPAALEAGEPGWQMNPPNSMKSDSSTGNDSSAE